MPTENDENSHEITVDNYSEGVSAFKGYRDAKQAADKETTSIALSGFEGITSNGAIIRIDLNYFSGMTVGEKRELMRFRNPSNMNTIMTVELEKASDHYSVNYTGFPPLVPFDGDEVLWFVIATDWDMSPRGTYIGFVPEGTVIGTGYTAQTVPSSIIPYCRNRYISGYTQSRIICEFNSGACGDLSDNTARVVVNNFSNVFTDRYGTISSDQAYYYKKDDADTIYTLSGTEMVPCGTFRLAYTDYIDFLVTDSRIDYARYSYNDKNFYTNATNISEHPPFFTFSNGVLTLWGFASDILTTANTVTITSLDGLTTRTVTKTNTTMNNINIQVLERAPSKDTYMKYLIQGPDYNVLADNPIDSEEFTYESSVLVCLDVANMKITFGDFRNNLLKDWTAGDWNGDGYNYSSYLISHPMNATETSSFTGRRITDLVHTKNLPYLITYFRRTETGELTTGELIYPSGCQGSILWDWRTSGVQGKWSSPTELYRPHKNTLFENGYIINKTNVRGLGRAYQIKLESDEAKQFILEGLVYDLKNDGRI